jgi:hypothetical protein
MVGENFLLFVPNKIKYNVCLVAHLDTHFDTNNRKEMDIYFDSGKKVLWSPQGLGADDRAGIYACMEIYKSFPHDKRPLMLFTDGEESGGTGASEVAEICGDFFKEHVGFFLQLDRMGDKETVFYSREPDDFIKYITDFGFTEKIGTFSDVAIISPAVGIASTNVSVGYYNEHYQHELLKLDAMQYSIDKVTKMVAEYNHKLQYKVPINATIPYGVGLYPSKYLSETEPEDKVYEPIYCYSCQSWFDASDSSGMTCPLCGAECTDSKPEKRWCQNCRDWFTVDDNFRGKFGEIYCPLCNYDIMEMPGRNPNIRSIELGGDGI